MNLRDQLEVAVDVLVGRHRRQEVARIGQAVGADRAEVGQPEAARRSSRRRSRARCRRAARRRKRTPRGITDDLLRLDLEHAELGGEAQAALLRHDQQLAVGVVEDSGPSSSGWRRTGAPPCRSAHRVAVAGHRDQPSTKSVGARRASAAGPSAAGSGGAGTLGEVADDPAAVHRCANGRCIAAGRMRYSQERRLSAARRGERGARELLRVQAVRRTLRRVAADRQGARAAPRSRTRCRSRSGSANARCMLVGSFP